MEVDRGRIGVGSTVLVQRRGRPFPEKTITATIADITLAHRRELQTNGRRRASFRAYAKLVNGDARMRPGMNSGADLIQTKIPDAVSIPTKALFVIAGKPVVYVKANGKYTPTTVRVLAKNPDEVAVDGIAGGTVVTLTEPPQEGQ